MADHISRDEVIKANIQVHTALANVYNSDPHFRPENKKKVSDILSQLRSALEGRFSEPMSLLDMGCGTGFIIHLAQPLFDTIYGVDITLAMVNQIDVSNGKTHIKICEAEQTPFSDNSFEAVTAYSFMDHLLDIEPFLREVYRVLKPGGVFYSDQNANRKYWQMLSGLESKIGEITSPIVLREYRASLFAEENLDDNLGVDKKAFRDAEFLKAHKQGICADEVMRVAQKVGFKKFNYKYDWFMGQGKVMHEQSFEMAASIENYLRSISPASDSLFKYIRFDLEK